MPRIRTINRKYKTRNIHPATVRAFLKSKDYRIGTWSANGRISGMSNFSGGNVEVKEHWINSDFSTEVLSDNFHKHITRTEVDVEVVLWNDEFRHTDIKKLAKDLRDGGFKIEITGDSTIIVKGRKLSRK